MTTRNVKIVMPDGNPDQIADEIARINARYPQPEVNPEGGAL